MAIVQISPAKFYINKQFSKPYDRNISFKKRESRTDASDFASIYFNTVFSVDPKTNIKKLAQKDGSGRVVKEIYLDSSDKIIRMKEYPQDANVKETVFENDGKTIKITNEYASDDEKILLKRIKYNSQDLPVEENFNRKGVMVKKIETKKSSDFPASVETITTIYSERQKPVEITEQGDGFKNVTKFFYDEKNRLTKTIYTETDFQKTDLYDAENEKIVRSDIHYFTKYQNPKAKGVGTDTYTVYEYGESGNLLRDKTFKTSDNELISGAKYNPNTGEKTFYLDRTYKNHHALIYRNGQIVTERFYPNFNTIKTYYYENNVPYREVILEKGKCCSDTLYKADKTKYDETKNIESQEVISKKYTKMDDYNFNKLLRLFNRKDVIEIEKDFSDSNYDIFKIKLPKNSTQEKI